jgi:hypothetical protein
MDTITGTLKNGHIVPDQPINWPEGSRVRIQPLSASPDSNDTFEDEESPEVIARWIAEFDAIPPWEMTPAEEARWQADRQAVKEYTVGKMKRQACEDPS